MMPFNCKRSIFFFLKQSENNFKEILPCWVLVTHKKKKNNKWDFWQRRPFVLATTYPDHTNTTPELAHV